MRTTRITIPLTDAQADRATAALMEDGIPFGLADASTLDRPPPGQVRLSVYVPPEEAGSLCERLRCLLVDVGIESLLALEEIDGDAWRDGWKEFWKPRPIGPFVIVPSWERYAPSPGETVIALDPGRAFGTGGHASTRLCLRALGRLDGCRRFLDVGCGSGVLAIACALRWPSARGVALDIDPEAIEVTRENAGNNHVLDRVQLPPTTVTALIETYDVVLANLTAETLLELAQVLADRVALGGRLIGSGILATEASRVAGALVAAGLHLESSEDEEEWRAITFLRAP